MQMTDLGSLLFLVEPLGLGKPCHILEARLDESSSTFLLKVEETVHLWLKESAHAGSPVACNDHVEPRQGRHLNIFNVTVRQSFQLATLSFSI